MLGADILVNNGDRAPGIHRDRQHKGNPGNILNSKAQKGDAQSTGIPSIVAVDNTTVGICDEAGCSRYFDCVTDFLSSAFDPEVDGKDIAVLQNLKTFVHDNTGVEVNEAGCACVRAGVIEGVARATAVFEANSLVFGEIKRDVAAEFKLQMCISSNGLKKTGAREGPGELAWQGLQMINIVCIKQVARRMLQVSQMTSAGD